MWLASVKSNITRPTSAIRRKPFRSSPRSWSACGSREVSIPAAVKMIGVVMMVPLQPARDQTVQKDEQDEDPDDDHGIRVGEFIDGLLAIGYRLAPHWGSRPSASIGQGPGAPRVAVEGWHFPVAVIFRRDMNAKPRIAHLAGPNATIQNSAPLVTSNKARETYGLPPLTDPTGNPPRFDVCARSAWRHP